MIPYSEYYREIRPLVKSCPDYTIQYALNRAVRDFCRESWVYEKTIVLNLSEDSQWYRLEFDTEDEVINIISAETTLWKLNPTRPQDVRQDEKGSPALFSFEPPNALILYPIPDKDVPNGLKVRMVLQPTKDSTTIPEMLDRLYKNYIVYGALSYLQEMMDDTWYNPQMAAENRRRFEIGVAEAKGQRARGFTSRNLRIKPRTFL